MFLTDPDELDRLDGYLDAGAQHIIIGAAAPFDLGPLRALLAAARLEQD